MSRGADEEAGAAATYDTWRLSNLRADSTGIAGVILWVACGEFGGPDPETGPRLMLAIGEKLTYEGLQGAVSVLLTDPPVVLGERPPEVAPQVVEFVDRNRAVLLRYCACEIDTREMCDALVRLTHGEHRS